MEYLSMKKRLTKIALAASILSMPVLAGANEYKSLFAVEGGASKVSADVTVSSQMYSVEQSKLGNVGIKIGAEGKNFRIFLSGRHYNTKDFDKLNTLGAEIEYLFHFSKPMSFFLSANTGKAFMNLGPTVNYPSVTADTYYFGGGAGLNLAVNNRVDIELGARYMGLGNTIVQGNTEYKFNDIISAYGAVIIKWQMD